ncbi:Hypothetical protein SMAX5B_012899 [Scophthalmus maximus]|uniref:Uncharacterized protein n=1 Tax=Scophthalmus maximus TaxID=52904 RepID=A0A2U9BA81_SCOMX|nr:Hypothetical protein SMAX5B_012899 [Scophthalmus maximus]
MEEDAEEGDKCEDGTHASSPEERRRKEVRLKSRGAGCVKDIQRGADCSGVRRGCCQHASCQHTPGARHTRTLRARPEGVCANPANCATTTHPPAPATTPEDPIWNQSTTTAPVPAVSPSL